LGAAPETVVEWPGDRRAGDFWRLIPRLGRPERTIPATG